jgi:hypothetical protein
MVWRLLSLCAIVSALSGCQCIGQVSALGSIIEGVTLQGPSRSDGEPTNLLEISVHDREIRSGDIPHWHVRGPSKASSAQYGVAPAGMVEIVPARPLEAGHTYRIVGWAKSGGVLGPRCRLMGSFHIDAQGKVGDVPAPSGAESTMHHGSQEGTATANRPPPNSALQRAGTHKVLGRGRSGEVLEQVMRARVLIGRRAVAELGS